ncbi:hypothetical protein IL306_005143 [Fusarium sp. DS 682]|nr:hypothetical protein IL306_005143 [Fusarium sp. DS 682]
MVKTKSRKQSSTEPESSGSGTIGAPQSQTPEAAQTQRRGSNTTEPENNDNTEPIPLDEIESAGLPQNIPIIMGPPPTIAGTPATATSIRTRLEATNERIRQLEAQQAELRLHQELQEAEEKAARLMEEIEAMQQPRESTSSRGSPEQRTEDTRPTRRRRSHDSDSDSSKEVKVKNITKIDVPCTARQREEWLSDLRRAFKGAPRTYKKGSNRVITATEYTNQEGRSRWEKHLKEQGGDRRESLENDWDYFEEWSLCYIKDSANRESLLMGQWMNARQRPGQSPQDFHNYLDSLETLLPIDHSQKARANFFFHKLLPELHSKIGEQIGELPQTREGMVTLATRIWDNSQRSRKRTNPSNTYDHHQQKRMRT